MKASIISQPFIALLATAPAYVTAAPITENPASDSSLFKRGLQDNCKNVPRFYDDSSFPSCWDKFMDKKSYSIQPGTAKDCIDLANDLEKNGNANWELGRGANRAIAVWKTCNFNARPVDDWVMKVGGWDVIDVLRDAVKSWCPKSYEIRDGKMVAVDDPVHSNCVMLGHGQMNECKRSGNWATSAVSFAIGQKAGNSQGSFGNDGVIMGHTWTRLPDCIRQD